MGQVLNLDEIDFLNMSRTNFFFYAAAAAALLAGGAQLRAEQEGAGRPGFQLERAPVEQPPGGYVPNSKFTRQADDKQHYNYTELPDASRGAGSSSGKGKDCARFVRGLPYGAMHAVSGEACGNGCEEVYRHDPGVWANLPLECKFRGGSVYRSPKEKPAGDAPAQVKTVRDRFFRQDGYHQILRADLTEKEDGWVVFLVIQGNRRARYRLDIQAEAGGCGAIPWIGFSAVDGKSVELRPGESTIALELAAADLREKIREGLASLSVEPDSCKTAVFLARLAPELPAESPYIGWTWLSNSMSFTVPICRFNSPADQPSQGRGSL